MSPRTSTPPKPYGWFPALTTVILAVIHVVNQLARAEGHAASSPSQALLAAYKVCSPASQRETISRRHQALGVEREQLIPDRRSRNEVAFPTARRPRAWHQSSTGMSRSASLESGDVSARQYVFSCLISPSHPFCLSPVSSLNCLFDTTVRFQTRGELNHRDTNFEALLPLLRRAFGFETTPGHLGAEGKSTLSMRIACKVLEF
ncbi:hypothetical protein EV126DRAFT_182548 [Verticillium dahliae]|nr:hypothetical protein EV126DRAFT_182548 [Verticillium dahliae]